LKDTPFDFNSVLPAIGPLLLGASAGSSETSSCNLILLLFCVVVLTSFTHTALLNCFGGGAGTTGG
jgi:hypothetical protein